MQGSKLVPSKYSYDENGVDGKKIGGHEMNGKEKPIRKDDRAWVLLRSITGEHWE